MSWKSGLILQYFEKCLFLSELRIFFGMNYNIRDIFEYIIVLVSEFARNFGLSDRQAYNYIRNHKGILFIEQNYGIIHTLDFKESVDAVATYCRRFGGAL